MASATDCKLLPVMVGSEGGGRAHQGPVVHSELGCRGAAGASQVEELHQAVRGASEQQGRPTVPRRTQEL